MASVLGLCALACTPADSDLADDLASPEQLPTSRSISLAPRQLKLMTWNVAFFEVTLTLFDTPIGDIDFTYQKSGSSFSGLSYEDRAHEIAAAIIRSDADVIALNEVYSEEVREILIDDLEAEYPHYVSKIWASMPAEQWTPTWDWLTDILPEDISGYMIQPLGSGLMLFSRVPFAELDASMEETCGDEDCHAEGQNLGGELQDEFLAFARYDDCSGLDCFSSKGVGLVKLDTSPQPTFVAFTHMQSDGGLDDVRMGQLAEADKLMTAVIPQGDLDGGPVYFAGDLNIVGGDPEWDDRFDPATVTGDTTFFACGNNHPCSISDGGRILTDAWGFETSPTDPGDTSSGGRRLDYILHGHADEAVCMQHITLPWFALEGGVQWFSDHKATMGDFATTAPRCSPNLLDPVATRRPMVLAFGPTDCLNTQCQPDITIDPAGGATIVNPGNMQWYIVDQPGAYSFDVQSLSSDADVEFDVYHHTDLSRPLKPFNANNKHPEFGWTFPMHDGPYYIRVFATNGGKPDRTVSGIDYELRAHQHLCREPEDACVLSPAVEAPYDWPDTLTSTKKVQELWFRFKTSSVQDGRLMPPGDDESATAYPDVDYFLETGPGLGGCWNEPILYEYDDPQVPQGVVRIFSFDGVTFGPGSDFDGDGDPDQRWQAPNLPSKEADVPMEYFARVRRTCEAAMPSIVRYETTLTHFTPGTLTCDEQFDDSGVGEDDHIRLDYTFDKPGGGGSPPCEPNCDYEGTFDEAWPEDMQTPGQDALGGVPALSGWYVDHMFPNMFESEGDVNDADATLHVQHMEPGGFDPLGMGPLSSTRAQKDGRFVYGDDADCDVHKKDIGDGDCNPDYWYTLTYEIDHIGPKYELE